MSTSDEIKRNSHNIWLAGLGAYSTKESEGEKTYESLLAKGKLLESKNEAKDAKSGESIPDSRLNDLKSKANQTMDRIERAFDLRVSSALKRLGISTQTDLNDLNAKIDSLTQALEQATKQIEE
ncbi:MAG: phasin family protein [Pseudomonadales bacterium]|nr:phasin family protein [Pseudomonadales bacterium]